jgi:hypothetical protein
VSEISRGDIKIKDGRIDLDIVVYVIGSACDGRHYMYKGQRWDSKKDLNKILKEDGVDPSSLEVKKDPESWEHTKKSLISYTEDIIEKSGTLDYRGFLTGHSNFRHEIATIQPYKGNRMSLEKPHHYDAIRQFLVDAYDAEISVNQEADDSIGLSHTCGETVIATLDKDLDVIPGDHFNWDRDEHYFVSELDADRNFYCQILTGDRTDNILGLYGVGEKSALVSRVKSMETPEEMHAYVYEQYEARFGSYAEQFMRENARLLWILQKRKNLFMN